MPYGFSGHPFPPVLNSSSSLTLPSLPPSPLPLPQPPQLTAVYAAGNTIPLPFIKAVDISPLAVVAHTGHEGEPFDQAGLEAIQELYRCGVELRTRHGTSDMSITTVTFIGKQLHLMSSRLDLLRYSSKHEEVSAHQD